MRDADTGPGCAVAARGVIHAAVEHLDPFRQPTTVAGRPVGATFLRHADEQTIAAVAAVNLAVEHLAPGVDFSSWGVLGCSQRSGRAMVAWNLARYRLEGAWAASPHIIPHRCLHSLSGMLSLALKCEGPNFGVGEPEAALPLACAWLAQRRVPGVLVALTSIDPELPPNPEQPTPHPGSVVHALALVLVPETNDGALRLRVRPASRATVAERWDLTRIDAWLAGTVEGVWPLSGGLVVERAPNSLRRTEVAAARLTRLQEVRS